MKLPTFKNPPIVEVVVGVQFAPLDDFLIPYVGGLWDCLGREKYPSFQETDLIIDGANPPIFGKHPLPRIWFVSGDSNNIIQFQVDRFLYNWRKEPFSDTDYPRYDRVINNFMNSAGDFSKYLHDVGIGPACSQKLELSYINLVKLDDFGGLSGIGNILNDISWNGEGRILDVPRKISGRLQFPIQEIASLMDIVYENGILLETGEEILKIEVSVKGQAPDPDMLKCIDWFNVARKCIVTGFNDITCSNAHSVWGIV